MPLTLITGPVGSGKTSAILERIAPRGSRRQGAVVVPTEGIAEEFRRHLLARAPCTPGSGAAVVGEAVLSWPAFVENIAEPRRPVLSGLEAALVLHRLLADHPLRYFRLRGHSIGIARSIANTILELKRGGISPERLARILETRGSLKENDLLTLFKRYERELADRGLLDAGDLPRLAARAIEKGSPALLPEIQALAFDEFPHFLPEHLSLFAAIKRAIPKLELLVAHSSPPGEGAAEAAFLERGLERISPLADRIEELPHRPAPPKDISVFSLSSPRQEARALARTIAEALATKEEGEIFLALRSSAALLPAVIEEAAEEGLIGRSEEISSPLDAPLLAGLLSPNLIATWPERSSLSELSEHCLAHLRRRADLEGWQQALTSNPLQRRQIGRTLSALASLEALLERLAASGRLIGCENLTREPFAQLLAGELSRPEHLAALAGRLPWRSAQFDDGLPFAADTLLLPRMVEGVIPRPAGERLFFSDADRLAHKPDRTLDLLFPSAEDLLALESYRFATFAAKCSRRLILTFPAIDESGSECAPSPFLEGLPEKVSLPAIPPRPAAEREPSWQERCGRAIQIELEREEGAGEHLAWRGVISDEGALALVRERFTREPISPTSLERYAGCPFVFFAEKVLGLEPLEEETPEILPKDRGTIIHALLERLYRDHFEAIERAARDGRGRARLDELIDALLEEVGREHAQLLGRASPALAPLELRSIRTMARQVVQVDLHDLASLPSPLVPAECEWAFGTEEVPALEIPLEDGPPGRIRGRIDRIDADRARSRFLVVDYKTGARVKSVAGEIGKGLHLQLPLYVEAVRRFLFPGALPLGGLLLSVQAAEKRHGFVLKEFNGVHYEVGRAHSAMKGEAWEQALSAGLSAAAAGIQGIRSGRFSAEEAPACESYCHYATACRCPTFGVD